jgi:hypothetical protein
LINFEIKVVSEKISINIVKSKFLSVFFDIKIYSFGY